MCPGDGRVRLPLRELFVVGLAVAGLAMACDGSTLPTTPLAALAHVVRTLEPALPRTLIASTFELPDDHPDHDELRFLRERRVIAHGAEVDPMSAEVWQAALDTIAGWYTLPPTPTGDPADAAQVRSDLDGLVDRVGRAVRPTALVAWHPDDEQRLAFLGLLWNWSAYPRLVVWRPGEDETLDGGLRAVAARLDTCAYSVTAFVGAPAPVARDLFLNENQATMYLVGSEPDLPGAWPYEVPAGEEVDVFAFTHPLVAGLDAYSAVFVGDAAPFFTFARLLPRVRTNLSPIAVRRVLQTPPR